MGTSEMINSWCGSVIKIDLAAQTERQLEIAKFLTTLDKYALAQLFFCAQSIEGAQQLWSHKRSIKVLGYMRIVAKQDRDKKYKEAIIDRLLGVLQPFVPDSENTTESEAEPLPAEFLSFDREFRASLMNERMVICRIMERSFNQQFKKNKPHPTFTQIYSFFRYWIERGCKQELQIPHEYVALGEHSTED